MEYLSPDVIRDRLAAGREVYYRSAAAEEERRDDLWKWFAVACVVCGLGELTSLIGVSNMNHAHLRPLHSACLVGAAGAGGGGTVGRLCLASRGRMLGRRRGVILALMAMAVAVPLVVLLNPTWMDRVPPPPGKPLLSVLVDASASMDVRDAPQQRSRYQEACRIAKAMVKDLGDRYEVRLRSFAAESSPTGIEALEAKQPDGAATDLAAAIDSALDSEQPQGQAVLLLSDGGHNVGGTARLREATARAKSQATPIFTHTIGGPAEVRDLEVEVQRPQELAFVRQQVPVAVTLRQRGSLAAQATLRLAAGGKRNRKANGPARPQRHDRAGVQRETGRRGPVPLRGAGRSAARRSHGGQQQLAAVAPRGRSARAGAVVGRQAVLGHEVPHPQPGDGRVDRVDGRRAACRRPAPGAEDRAEDKTADDQWTIEKDAGKFLADRATLASYQIVILGRNAEVFLSDEALTRLTKWLDSDDGSLVCFRGAPSLKISQRLDELMPVRWTASAETRFRAQWTDEGQALRWLPGEGETDPLTAMPALATTAQPKVKPYVATVLATNAAGGGADGAAGDLSGGRQRGQRPRGGRGRGRHVALGLPASAAPGPRRTLWFAVAEPHPLAGDQRRHAAFPAAGLAGREDARSTRKKTPS